MPICPTKYFGPTEYEDTAVVRFCAGLPGFEDERDFLPLHLPAHDPLVFLQSLATPDLCFTALPVLAVDSGYRLEVAEQDLETLGFGSRQPLIGRDVLCLAILTIEETGVTANLLAPVVINLNNRRAVQAVAPGLGYSHRYPLGDPAEALCS